MTMTHKPLRDPGYLSTSDTAEYTVAASTTGYVKAIILHNTDTTNTILATLYHVPSGQSVGASYTLYQVYLPPLETLMIECQGAGIALETGDKLYAKAGTASKVVCAVYGAEES